MTSDKPLTRRQQQVFDFIATTIAHKGYPPSMREIGDGVGLVSLSSVSHQLNRLEALGHIRRSRTFSRAIEVIGDTSHLDLPQPGAQPEPSDTTEAHTAGSEAAHSESARSERAGNTAAAADSTGNDSTPGGTSSADTNSMHNALTPEAARLVPLVGQIAAGVPITAEQHVDDLFPLPQTLVGSGDLFMLKVVGDSMIDAAICDGDFVVVRQQREAQNGDIVAAMLDGEATVKVFKQRDGHTWLLPQNSLFEPILGDYAEVLGKVVAVFRAVA